MKLSILDLVPLPEGSTSSQALANSLDLARTAERLGYHRVWYAEHHNLPTVLSTTPEILIAVAGRETTRIRLGSGGVMLPNHAPLKVAETYKLLEALYPGRIDLGIGRAPGTDPETARALRGVHPMAVADRFPEELADLVEFGRSRGTVTALPLDVPLPPIYLLSSSGYSAEMAAMLGMGFGFAAHFSDLPPDGPMLGYRDAFQPSGALQKPYAILTLSVICADTEAEARRLSSSLVVAFTRLRTGQRSRLLPPEEALAYSFSAREQMVADSLRPLHILGTPETVRRRVQQLVERTQADEVMVTCFVHGHKERLRSYELLSEAFATCAKGLSHNTAG